MGLGTWVSDGINGLERPSENKINQQKMPDLKSDPVYKFSDGILAQMPSENGKRL
ncbi:hypothetical protein [Neisseria sp. CCUG12390]|uniref:hypothetical protein n=1 Tax=Neisseria sp. CCUG12390 TaxID=3392035 RepID=UPI003A0FD347